MLQTCKQTLQMLTSMHVCIIGHPIGAFRLSAPLTMQDIMANMAYSPCLCHMHAVTITPIGIPCTLHVCTTLPVCRVQASVVNDGAACYLNFVQQATATGEPLGFKPAGYKV